MNPPRGPQIMRRHQKHHGVHSQKVVAQLTAQERNRQTKQRRIHKPKRGQQDVSLMDGQVAFARRVSQSREDREEKDAFKGNGGKVSMFGL